MDTWIEDILKRRTITEEARNIGGNPLWVFSDPNATKKEKSIPNLIEALKKIQKSLSKSGKYTKTWIDIGEREVDEFRHTESYICISGERLENDKEYNARILWEKTKLQGEIERHRSMSSFYETADGRRQVEWAYSKK